MAKPLRGQALRLVVVAVAALLIGLVATNAGYRAALPGLTDAGPLVGWGRPISGLIATALAIAVLGLLVHAAFFAEQKNDGLTPESRNDVRTAVRLASLWAIAELTQALFTLSSVLGINLGLAAQPTVIGKYMWSLEASRLHVIAAVLALIIGLVGAFVTTLDWTGLLAAIALVAVGVPQLGNHAAALGDHSLALTSAVLHAVGISLWIGGLVAVLRKARPSEVRRYSHLAFVAYLVVAISGATAAYTRLDSIAQFVTTAYGRIVLIKLLILVGVGFLAKSLRAKAIAGESLRGRIVAIETLLLTTAGGLGLALSNAKYPRTSRPLASAAEDLLGWNFPPPPTVVRMLTGLSPEWAMLTICLTAAALYAAGVMRLRRNQVHWGPLRTLSFATGLWIVVWATSSNLSRYATISFSAHMVQHMILSMLAPIFLVLGAPVTLALRALPAISPDGHRTARDWLLALLHSRYSNFITHPIIVLIIFTFGLYGVYFTSVFDLLMGSHVGHVFMGIHFLLTGFLFSFVVIGVDPMPRETPQWARLFLVLLALSLHGFFAIALMQSTVPIGRAWFSQVQPPWISNPLTDTYTGGGAAWALGEIPTLILMIAVAAQWAISDGKLARRLDRAADRDGDAELNAYNEYLAALNRQDES